ncbi:lysoplasmalogenase [Lacinutrix sp. Bg11-31]|uniref:lysoplasmalogenase n=1 Tax=Lacinutrix sp. Bg11-31 TaxID=2057808 RepID=UPI000C319AC7|nr:lysoplasmalogenase [Lacinutrix sp. Bg11-31]AUC81004.1 hypothetical protein CW733_02185 [Lacinutrix sp. Bg11-31]
MLDNFFNIKKPYFVTGYFSILFIDLLCKLYLDPIPYRYITKSLLMILLIVFYLKNYNKNDKKKHYFTFLALFLFWTASVSIINHINNLNFIISMLFFILAKIMYCFRFTNNRDFKISRLVPFLAGGFVFMVSVLSLIYKGLGDFFIPVLIYFFVSLLLCIFAYLRKGDVNTKSYNLVLIAMFFLILSEVIMGVKTYYRPLPFQNISVMLFYGIAQFLIVYGILIEVKIAKENS